MLVLENKYSYSWDICISASEVSSGVAFYSYDDIAQAFSNYRVSIYDMGQLHIFTSNYTEIYGPRPTTHHPTQPTPNRVN